MDGNEKERVRRWQLWLPLKVACVLLLALLTMRDAAALAVRPEGFCRASTIRDLEKPLANLPPVAGFPSDGHLGFGPNGLSIEPLRPGGNPNVVFKGAPRRFQLSNSGPSDARLDWTIQIELLRVEGTAAESLSTSSSYFSHAGTPGSRRSFESPAISRPGSYRLNLVVVDAQKAVLGNFSEYVQVVSPTFEPRLTMQPRSVLPRTSVVARVDNLGTRDITYGRSFRLSRFESGRWVNLPQHPFFGSLASVPGGKVGPCERVTLPVGSTPGFYRIGKRIGSPRSSFDRWLSQTFWIREKP